MPDMNPESAYLLIEDIRRLLAEREYLLEYQDQKITKSICFSAGISGFPKDGKETYEVIRAADEALYRAKLSGRNRITLAVTEKMKTKTSYYTISQLARLSNLSKQIEKSESFLLREALDNILEKYKA